MTREEMMTEFEAWYTEEYSWELRRGGLGRAGLHLKKHDGLYLSDRVRNDFKVWCAAYKRMNK